MPPDLPRNRKSVSIYSRSVPVTPNDLNTLSIEKVRRINKIVAKRKMSQSFIKFSKRILKENVWRSVWRSCMWILGFKGLRVSAKGLSCCSCQLCSKLLPEKTVAGRAQSVGHLTAEQEFAGSTPWAGPILMVLK